VASTPLDPAEVMVLTEAIGRCPAFRTILGKLELIEELMRGREKPFYSVDEVAERYGRSAYTIRRWISEGRLKATRLQDGGPRGRLMIAREELARLDVSGSIPASDQ